MISERPGSENYETTEPLSVFHVLTFLSPRERTHSLPSPSGSRREAPHSTAHRVHTLCQAWLLVGECGHNRLQNDRQATLSHPLLWLTLDALNFHAERPNDASGCSWLQETVPGGHGPWSATPSRGLPGPGLRVARDGRPPGGPRARPPRSGLSVPSEKWGERLHARPRRPRAVERPRRGNVGTASARTNPATRPLFPGRLNPLPPRLGRPPAQPAALTTPLAGTARRTPGRPGRRWRWPSADRKAPSRAWLRPRCPASRRPAARRWPLGPRALRDPTPN